jgi:hypothetical protein
MTLSICSYGYSGFRKTELSDAIHPLLMGFIVSRVQKIAYTSACTRVILIIPELGCVDAASSERCCKIKTCQLNLSSVAATQPVTSVPETKGGCVLLKIECNLQYS